MLVLSRDELSALLAPRELIAIVESALHAQAQGRIEVPQRLHLDWHGNTLLTMPAAADTGFGVKLVSVFPGNAARGLPVITGIMILNDPETGAPQVIMDAAALTAQRTGAVGALGMKYLTPPTTSSVGIVGCGVQGAWQAVFSCAVRPIQEVFVLERSAASLAKFEATVARHAPSLRLTRCKNIYDVLDRTDVIVTATTSSTPVLPDEPDILRNKHFISLGSFKPTMQELPDSVYQLTGQLAVDAEHARHEVGDVMNPIRRGILTDADVYPIAECVLGKRSVDTGRTTAYKSVGAALYDLFVAQAFHAAARARGLGREIAL